MKNPRWKYKTRGHGGGVQSFIPIFILLALFGGITVWLYSSGNGAYIFTAALFAVSVVILLYSIYSCIFVKLFVGDKGFYRQTRPGNGKYYAYTEIAEAWESTGTSPNGTVSYYCHYKTLDGKSAKFWFTPMESDGIDYLLTHVEERNAGAIEGQRQDKWTYKIDGKSNAHPLMAIPLAVISVFFLILAVDQLQPRPGKTALFAFFFGLMAVIILYGLIAVLVRYFCFSVYIGDNGFYFRSHPFNGKFYRFSLGASSPSQKFYFARQSIDMPISGAAGKNCEAVAQGVLLIDCTRTFLFLLINMEKAENSGLTRPPTNGRSTPSSSESKKPTNKDLSCRQVQTKAFHT